MTPQSLEEKLIDFAVTIAGVVASLPNSRAGNHRKAIAECDEPIAIFVGSTRAADESGY